MSIDRAPFHMQQAIDLLDKAPLVAPVFMLARAGIHAVLAVADAIERQTRTTIAIEDENRKERR